MKVILCLLLLCASALAQDLSAQLAFVHKDATIECRTKQVAKERSGVITGVTFECLEYNDGRLFPFEQQFEVDVFKKQFVANAVLRAWPNPYLLSTRLHVYATTNDVLIQALRQQSAVLTEHDKVVALDAEIERLRSLGPHAFVPLLTPFSPCDDGYSIAGRGQPDTSIDCGGILFSALERQKRAQ